MWTCRLHHPGALPEKVPCCRAWRAVQCQQQLQLMLLWRACCVPTPPAVTTGYTSPVAEQSSATASRQHHEEHHTRPHQAEPPLASPGPALTCVRPTSQPSSL